MNTAVFELLGKLAAGAGSGQTSGAAPSSPLAPLLTSLPTEGDCALQCQERPLLFFYDPHSTTSAAGAATRPPSSHPSPAPPQPIAFTSVSSWPVELSTACLRAPTTSLRSLCVVAAEDDVASRMNTTEVWAEWPQTLGGWQLCPTSHLCAAVVVGKSGSRVAAGDGYGVVYLLASRYELIGTSTVYERYLLLSGSGAGGAAVTDAAALATATCIGVQELRKLRRLACLCRCFCSNGREVQPRAAGAREALLLPPPPPADHFLRLVPTSLQYTFCFTTTALLSVAEEERCQGWAMATAKLAHGRKHAGGASRHRSCSTEAANTSGALSDGDHTAYQDSVSFSRERSTSTVRLVDGVSVLGHRENPRSARSTPARPAVVSRLDEQQQQQQQRVWAEAEVKSRLPQSQRWRALALNTLIDTSYYDDQVPAGWRRWRDASNGILCRPLVVDSLDGIVRYIHGSRLAFYTAVAFLDRFIATTVDPAANVQAYRCQLYRARTGQQMDFSMLTHGGVNTRGVGVDGSDVAEVHARDICGFLTQVIVVCIMLGSKTVDLYPPRIRQLMGCVEDTEPICEQEFVMLELHVLLTLGFPVHPVTLFESANALLTFSSSERLYATLTASHTTRRLLEEYQDRGQLVDDVEKLFAAQAEKDAAAAVVGATGGAAHPSPYAMAGGRSTDVPTRGAHRAINDWLRLRLFTHFVCDEVIRADVTGTSTSASSSTRGSHRSSPRATVEAEEYSRVDSSDSASSGSDAWQRDGNVLQYAPVLVATAALVVAAEQVGLPLPGPLLRLLPRPVRERLSASSPAIVATASRLPLCCNEESNGLLSHDSALSASYTAQPGDSHYRLLEEVSVVVEAELVRLSSTQQLRRGMYVVGQHSSGSSHQHYHNSGLVSPPPRAFATAAGEEEEEGAGTRGMSSSSSPPLMPGTMLCAPLPPADAAAVALMGRIVQQVRDIHFRSRESCPPVLLQRYQPLFHKGL